MELTGKGILVDPDGVRLELPYRKVADLLALLALPPNQKWDRENLARSLWPESPRIERMTSLRQALSRLRSLVGSETLFADRNFCQLNLGLPLVVSGEAIYYHGTTEPIAESGQNAFGDAVEAMSLIDPESSLQQLRKDQGVHPGIEPGQLLRIIANWKLFGPPTPAQWAWIYYCRGITSLRHDIEGALPLLNCGAHLAEKTRQWDLLSKSAFWMGTVHILQGDVQSAERLGEKVSAGLKTTDPQGSARMENLLAHARLHLGDTDGCLMRLARFESQSVLSIQDRRTSEALRCLYLAYEGRLGEAERLLTDLEGPLATTGHTDMHDYWELAKVVIETLDYRNQSLAKAEDLADQLASRSSLHLELYTRELIAVRALERSKPAHREAQRPRIKYLRNSVGMTQTVWDRKRLQPRGITS